MFDSFVRYKADKNRLTFIRNCETFDTPRLENEVYPAECKTEMDIEYKHGNNPLKLDIYTPFNCYGAKECFILIHGGAYVYGFKKLDQNFGMHLAIKANIPVVNIDYTLMPESDLSQVINEIFTAINFVPHGRRFGRRFPRFPCCGSHQEQAYPSRSLGLRKAPCRRRIRRHDLPGHH